MHQITASSPVKITEDGESRPRYRADVDGLRAVAIIAVVLYHATVPFFGGGYVGVDVFFVISGFLIGGIVFRDVSSGRFTFATFYARRAKRIVPALLGMSLVFSGVALALLPPDQLAAFAKSNASALVGAANVRFWMLAHYFGMQWHQDQLVMTWSLGVEEQFYLFLPPLMLAVHRFAPRRLVAVIVILSALSLALSVRLTTGQPTAAFYLLPGRAWELGAGVLMALWLEQVRRRVARRPAEVLSVLAAVAVLAPIALYDEETPFPGLAAALPVFGTAALIFTEPSTINRVVLASPPMRFIGLVSYSWYLWHWPTIAFARIALGRELSPILMALAVAASFAAAVISWRFIETPFRRPSRLPNPRLLLRYAAALGASLGVAGACYTVAAYA
jgi:peptidoglycan/LPS O-acetylase OafA/YrhL